MSTHDELMDWWEELREQGIVLGAEQLCSDHPELLESVRREIQALNAFDSRFGIGGDDVAEVRATQSGNYAPPDSLQIASRFNLVRCHATGGLGQVFVATDEVLGRRVAIKFPKRQGMTEEQIQRFNQEAQITGQLDHPSIVPIYALDSIALGEPCYVMRFVEGRTLHEEVSDALIEYEGLAGPAYWNSETFRKLLQSLIAVCNAVAFAHGHNVIHRDIKPNNILIGPFGETLLLDWGLAKRLTVVGSEEIKTQSADGTANAIDVHASPTITEPGKALGTPAYASPEQILGQTEVVAQSSDIFSLGATLFYILCGKSPMEMLGWSEYLNILRDPKNKLEQMLPASVPKSLRAICAKSISLEIDSRYSDPLLLAVDVDRHLAREPISVLDDPWWTRGVRAARKRPAVTGAVLAACLVLVLAAIGSSLIVGAKNRQLATSNNNLTTALGNVQSANDVAMQALRSMVNEAVSHRMSQHGEMSESDREYIKTILDQYLTIAALKSNSTETQVLRAEALGQVGCLYYQLNQNAEAEKHLIESVEILRPLLSVSQDPQIGTFFGRFAETLTAIQVEAERNQEAEGTATAGIELLSSLQNSPQIRSSVDGDELASDLGSTLVNLYEVRANARASLGNVANAYRDFDFAVASIEKKLTQNSTNVHSLFSLGSTLRTYSSVRYDLAKTGSEYLDALKLASRSVELLTQATEISPDTHRYSSALAWAYYDRSFIHESLGNLKEAIQDMWYAGDITQKIAKRYPMFQTYEERVPTMLARRSKLHLDNQRTVAAYTDARNMSDLKLNQVQLSKCIDLLNTILESADVETIDQRDAFEHIADLYARRSRLLHSQARRSEALTDLEMCCQIVDQELLLEKSTTVIPRVLLWRIELAQLQLLVDQRTSAAATLEVSKDMLNRWEKYFSQEERASYQKMIDALVEASQVKDQELSTD